MNPGLTPYRVILRSYPRYPYIGMVWAKSQTIARRLFARHLQENNYSRARISIVSYDAIECKRKMAIVQNDPITIFQGV